LGGAEIFRAEAGRGGGGRRGFAARIWGRLTPGAWHPPRGSPSSDLAIETLAFDRASFTDSDDASHTFFFSSKFFGQLDRDGCAGWAPAAPLVSAPTEPRRPERN